MKKIIWLSNHPITKEQGEEAATSFAPGRLPVIELSPESKKIWGQIAENFSRLRKIAGQSPNTSGTRKNLFPQRSGNRTAVGTGEGKTPALLRATGEDLGL